MALVIVSCGSRAPIGAPVAVGDQSPRADPTGTPSPLLVDTGARILLLDEPRQVIVIGTYRGAALLVTDLRLGQPSRKPLNSTSAVTGAAVDVRSGLVYAATSDGELWAVPGVGAAQRAPIGPNPSAVVFDPDRGHVLVADLGAGNVGGSIRTFDARTLAAVARTELSGRPLGLALDASRSRVYVSMLGSLGQPGVLAILDASTLRSLGQISIGPITFLALTPDGSRLYALQRAELDPRAGVTAGKLWSIDADDFAKRHAVDLRNPSALAVTNKRAFVADYDTGDVAVIEGDRVVSMIRGLAHPTGLVALANGQRIYVSSIDDLSVKAIETP